MGRNPHNPKRGIIRSRLEPTGRLFLGAAQPDVMSSMQIYAGYRVGFEQSYTVLTSTFAWLKRSRASVIVAIGGLRKFSACEGIGVVDEYGGPVVRNERLRVIDSLRASAPYRNGYHWTAKYWRITLSVEVLPCRSELGPLAAAGHEGKSIRWLSAHPV